MERHIPNHPVEMLSMIKQLLQLHYCQWPCFYQAAWQIHTRVICTHIHKEPVMLLWSEEDACWADRLNVPAGLQPGSERLRALYRSVSVYPLLASSCIHAQWVTGQQDTRMLVESNKVSPFETWDLAQHMTAALNCCESYCVVKVRLLFQVIERGLVTLDPLLAGIYFTTRQNRPNLVNASSVSAVSKPTAIWLISHIRESCYRELSVLTFGLYRLLESQDNAVWLIRPQVPPTSSQRSGIVKGSSFEMNKKLYLTPDEVFLMDFPPTVYRIKEI